MPKVDSHTIMEICALNKWYQSLSSNLVVLVCIDGIVIVFCGRAYRTGGVYRVKRIWSDYVIHSPGWMFLCSRKRLL